MDDKKKEILKKLNVIDLSGVNFWIVNLNPGGEDKDKVYEFQRTCIKNKCFAMCWRNDKCQAKDKTKAIYDDINQGDYVIWRDKQSICRIGRVKETCQYDNSGEITYCGSYYCKVDEWKEFKDIKSIPTEVWARFTHRHQSTIRRISDTKVRIFIMKMYHSHKNLKYYVNSENYVRSLNYYDLEDVVSIYIHEKLSKYKPKSDYVLIPSTGKSSRQNYEFDFIDINGKKDPVSCQVKNQEKINVENYINHHYSKVYLFSGIGYENEDKYNNIEEKYKIYKIDKKTLYECVEKYIKKIKSEDIYAFSETYTVKEFIDDFLKGHKLRSKNKKDDKERKENWKKDMYDISEGYVTFDKGNIYFCEDFQSIVIENNKDKETFDKLFKGFDFKNVYEAYTKEVI